MGALVGLAPGGALVDMTTSDPTLATEIAEVTADKGRSPAVTVGPARRRSPSSLAATQPWSPASRPCLS
uniref:6-phosphogluconate dehydrogenase NADP-binding domain-containing protein n=1 Tax=Oryza barthii TaxID=65489 RepID=A0A0D3F326_9ORYZ